MYSGTIVINGFSFRVLGDSPGENGVLVPPDADLDNPEYVSALKVAVRAYKYKDMVHVLQMVMYDFRRTGRHYQDMQDVLAALVELPQQSYIPVPDGLLSAVQEALNPEIARRKQQELRQQEKRSRTKNRAGYVYLIQSDTGYYKIGRTKNPDNRLETFKVTLPFAVEYLTTMYSLDMYALERQLHEHFANKRVDGEWFALDELDVQYLKELGR